MNIRPRANEFLSSIKHTRTDRILVGDDGYYYKTREGELHGVFETREQALYDLNVFIRVTEIEQEYDRCGQFEFA